MTEIYWKQKAKTTTKKRRLIFFFFLTSLLKPAHSNFKGKALLGFLYWERKFCSSEVSISPGQGCALWWQYWSFHDLVARIFFYFLAFPDTFRVMWKRVGAVAMELRRMKWGGAEKARGELTFQRIQSICETPCDFW